MKRIKKNVFLNLAVRMIGFGLGVGLVFPFFTTLMGVDRSIVYTLRFFSACIAAGLTVG